MSFKLFSLTVTILSIDLTTTYQQSEEHIDYYEPPKYKFNYAVHDPHTGDMKSHWESREGDTVIGAYTVHDPDGHLRVVEYHADPHTGFQAHVKRTEEYGSD